MPGNSAARKLRASAYMENKQVTNCKSCRPSMHALTTAWNATQNPARCADLRRNWGAARKPTRFGIPTGRKLRHSSGRSGRGVFARWGGRRGQRGQPFGKNVRHEVYKFFRAGTIRVPVRIVFGDVEAQEIF